MNEDRHAGNWGITDDNIALLFDHNNSFGGEEGYTNVDQFMVTLTSAFYVDNEYQQRHDTILSSLTSTHPEAVEEFMVKVNALPEISNNALDDLMPEDFARVKMLLKERILYMNRKVGEFSGR